MILRQPRTFTIDLSSVEVDKPFTLQAFAMATAYNRIAGPPSEFGSSATAFLRDPQGIGGTAITSSGLEPTDVLGLDPPAQTLSSPRRARRTRPVNRHPAVQRQRLHHRRVEPDTAAVRVTGPAAAPARSPPRSRRATAAPWPGPTTRRCMPPSASPTAMTPHAPSRSVLPDQLGGEGDRTVAIHPFPTPAVAPRWGRRPRPS